VADDHAMESYKDDSDRQCLVSTRIHVESEIGRQEDGKQALRMLERSKNSSRTGSKIFEERLVFQALGHFGMIARATLSSR